MSDEIAAPALITLNDWRGVHLQFFEDRTDEIDIEGARMSAKTTVCLDKEIWYLKNHPGIEIFLCRYSDTATRTKLVPRFERLCSMRGLVLGTDYKWDSKELCYNFTNGSKAYVFGLKAASAENRYEKLRGLDVARVYNDQSEELPADIGQELRASMRQKGYPHQITFSPNPIATTHWLAKKDHGGFPENNSVDGRRYYGLSIYDNAYNLPPESIARMERTYPVGHAKHRAMILGKRGPNVIGDAIFEHTFKRALHVRPVQFDPSMPLLEAFDFGKHSPCYVAAQRFYTGGLAFLGGVIGEDMFLDDFLPIVKQARLDWFGELPRRMVKTCCPPPPTALAGTRFTNQILLDQAGFRLTYRENGNAHDVMLALLDRLTSYMRRRSPNGEESLAVNDDDSHWLKVSFEGIEQSPFLEQALEANAVWDEHFSSVSNQKVRQVHDDDWFANALRCVQHIELNFCADTSTQSERDRKAAANRARRESAPHSQSADSWLAH